jgi:hypothetical protein
MGLSATNMTPGTHTVYCYYRGGPGSGGGTHLWSTNVSITIRSDGSFSGEAKCAVGNGYADQAWVVVDGVKSNEVRPW